MLIIGDFISLKWNVLEGHKQYMPSFKQHNFHKMMMMEIKMIRYYSPWVLYKGVKGLRLIVQLLPSTKAPGKPMWSVGAEIHHTIFRPNQGTELQGASPRKKGFPCETAGVALRVGISLPTNGKLALNQSRRGEFRTVIDGVMGKHKIIRVFYYTL